MWNPKKSYRHICKKTIDEIVCFIETHKSQYTVKLICKVLKFPRSTYYKALNSVPSNRELENQRLDEEIRSIYYESKKRYGAPKIQKVLESKGIPASLKRVQRHMAVMELRSIVVKKYRPHSSKGNVEERENLLNRDF